MRAIAARCYFKCFMRNVCRQMLQAKQIQLRRVNGNRGTKAATGFSWYWMKIGDFISNTGATSWNSHSLSSFIPFFVCRSLTQNHHSLIPALTIILKNWHSRTDSLVSILYTVKKSLWNLSLIYLSCVWLDFCSFSPWEWIVKRILPRQICRNLLPNWF